MTLLPRLDGTTLTHAYRAAFATLSWVGEADHVGDHAHRHPGIVLGQKIRLFVLVAQEPRRRGVPLAEHQMPDDAEPCRAPCLHEQVHLVPAVEADREAAVLQHAV